ncbi:hypothetical protein [Acidocella sp.]|uniref:hypothetical protein n=1 Tax=Acidocella sp. TaxID=50710 RepID=UPI002614C8FE|nr:hypothetical protein [Acidocella sp.]
MPPPPPLVPPALPPAVIVHGLPDIRAALAANQPVTLLSAPGAVLYAGCGWWASLLAAAQVNVPALLDCADAPGRAWEALKLGLPGVILHPCPAAAQVAEYAALRGAILLPAAPPALDLGLPGAAWRLDNWLAGDFNGGGMKRNAIPPR